MRIIGIDPGSRITGYGIVSVAGSRIEHVDSGHLCLTEHKIPLRLARIFEGLSALIQEYQPRLMAVEKVFMHHNADSAIKLGQARGAAICAGVVAGLSVEEFSPNEIKRAVVGHGHADKKQIQFMVVRLLRMSEELQTDCADALAVAVCMSNHLGTQRLLARRSRPTATNKEN